MKLSKCLIMLVLFIGVVSIGKALLREGPPPPTQEAVSIMLASLGAPANSCCDDCTATYRNEIYQIATTRNDWYFRCVSPASLDWAWKQHVRNWEDCKMAEAWAKYNSCLSHCEECDPVDEGDYGPNWPPTGYTPSPWIGNPGSPVDDPYHSPCEVCHDDYQWDMYWVYRQYWKDHATCLATYPPGTERNDCVDWLNQQLEDLVDLYFEDLKDCLENASLGGCTPMPTSPPDLFWDPSCVPGGACSAPDWNERPTGCYLSPPDDITAEPCPPVED